MILIHALIAGYVAYRLKNVDLSKENTSKWKYVNACFYVIVILAACYNIIVGW